MKRLLVYLIALIFLAACVKSEQEAIDVEMKSGYGPVHPECGTCIRSSDVPINCTQYLWTKPLTRTEWTELFPDAHFYLIGTNLIQNGATNRYGYQQRYFVIAQQGDKRYQAETFDQFLDGNGVIITDTQRELIAKSFALMTLGNYFENEIAFSGGEEIDEHGAFDMPLNYGITAHARTQGLSIRYKFWFFKGYLMQAIWYAPEQHNGDYVDVPFTIMPLPGEDIYFQYAMDKVRG